VIFLQVPQGTVHAPSKELRSPELGGIKTEFRSWIEGGRDIDY